MSKKFEVIVRFVVEYPDDLDPHPEEIELDTPENELSFRFNGKCHAYETTDTHEIKVQNAKRF